MVAAKTGEATEAAWAEQLERLARRITRLGAINLAAIDEYRTQAERKEYLDAQHDDLNAALTTLENAIQKIDRETRNRFKETFSAINNGLQELFPRVFGGGLCTFSDARRFYSFRRDGVTGRMASLIWIDDPVLNIESRHPAG